MMEDMEKLLKSMTDMKDGLENIQKELGAYVLSHEENGVKVEVRGDGWITVLQFADGTPADVVAAAVNNANTKVKNFITNKMNEITPPELRDAQ